MKEILGDAFGEKRAFGIVVAYYCVPLVGTIVAATSSASKTFHHSD